MSRQCDDVVTGNTFDKYRTKKPIYQSLMNRFLHTVFGLAAELDIDTALEMGCRPSDFPLVSNDFQIDFRRPFPWLMLIAEKK